MKYRKKPVVIEAWQFPNEFCDETPHEFHMAIKDVQVNVGEWRYHINTLEGSLEVSLGDYIIKGINGEFYPIKPDIFEMTYERVIE